MKLSWSQAENGNWNGKRGQYTLVAISYHQGDGWWLHPKMPGIPGQRVDNPQAGMDIANRLFDKWFKEVQG